jgi:thiosulfate/3-mercaptopyruvate sulfurtransferase
VSLITVAELAAALDDPDLRIADVRWSLAAPAAGRVAYAAAHLPGAVFVDLDTVLTAPVGPGRHPLPDPATFAAALGALGIGRGHRVVAYDDAGGTVAARLWWMLDALGQPGAAVLDGGIEAWQAAGLPVTAEVPAFAVAEPLPTPEAGSAWPRTIGRVKLAARLGKLTILDARARERYRGDVEPIDRIAGHIPTARSLPTTALLAPGGRFLAADVLVARFAAVGVATRPGGAARLGAAPGRAARLGAAPGRAVSADQVVTPGAGPDASAEVAAGQVVVSCGSGVNACQLALGMRAAGLPDPLLYPGSYSDWTQSGLPIATGDEPGAPPNSFG